MSHGQRAPDNPAPYKTTLARVHQAAIDIGSRRWVIDKTERIMAAKADRFDDVKDDGEVPKDVVLPEDESDEEEVVNLGSSGELWQNHEQASDARAAGVRAFGLQVLPGLCRGHGQEVCGACPDRP